MQSDDASWNYSHRAETVEPGVVFGRNEYDPSFFSRVEFIKRCYKRLHLLVKLLAALSPWDRPAVGTCRRGSEECAYALSHFRGEEVVELACIILYLFVNLHLECLGKESLCKPVPPYNLFCPCLSGRSKTELVARANYKPGLRHS